MSDQAHQVTLEDALRQLAYAAMRRLGVKHLVITRAELLALDETPVCVRFTQLADGALRADLQDADVAFGLAPEPPPKGPEPMTRDQAVDLARTACRLNHGTTTTLVMPNSAIGHVVGARQDRQDDPLLIEEWVVSAIRMAAAAEPARDEQAVAGDASVARVPA